MLEEERKLHRERMKQYQRQLREQFAKDLVDMSKSINDILACKVQELNNLKASYRQLGIANTALEAKHAILTFKSTATDGYAQIQKDLKELQLRLKSKEDESELYEKQCILLTEAFIQ
jgi:hypothetical protein